MNSDPSSSKVLVSRLLRTYGWKMFIADCLLHKISVSLYHKEWQFSCHLTTGRNVQDLLLENVLPQNVYCTKKV